jgi:hypothetical protein
MPFSGGIVPLAFGAEVCHCVNRTPCAAMRSRFGVVGAALAGYSSFHANPWPSIHRDVPEG